MARELDQRVEIGAGRDLVAPDRARQEHPGEPGFVQAFHERIGQPPVALDGFGMRPDRFAEAARAGDTGRLVRARFRCDHAAE